MLVAVAMVNFLIVTECPAQHLFSGKPMLVGVAANIRKVMIESDFY